MNTDLLRAPRLAVTVALSAILAGCSGQAAISSPMAPASPPESAGPTEIAPPTASPEATATPTPVVTTRPMPSPTPTATPMVTPSPALTPRPMPHLTIRPGPPMTTARNGQAAVLLRDGRVLILGGAVPPEGECGMGCVLPLTASVEIYDPKTDTFHRNGSLVHPRTGADAALLRDGRVLVAGGYVESGTAQYLEIYDPATGRSTAVKPAAGNPALPNGYATALLSDGRALLVGGWYGGTPPSTSNATRIFDPAKRTFSRGPLLARPRQYAGATVLRDGRVLVLGGERFEGDGGVTDHSAELIDPRRIDARSTHLESASTFLRGQAPMTAVLADGRVLLAGIGDSVPSGACAAAPAAAVFDPATMSFAQAGLLHTPRAGFAAIPLRDGRALLIGGVDASCNAVSAVEAFDPASRSFTVVSTDLPDLRQGLTATRLNDDRVLVTSGSGTPSTWLLEP